MAIEDHPNFPKWSAALDRLNRAWDAYTTAKAFSPNADFAALEAEVIAAMKAYNEASDEIDS